MTTYKNLLNKFINIKLNFLFGYFFYDNSIYYNNK